MTGVLALCAIITVFGSSNRQVIIHRELLPVIEKEPSMPRSPLMTKNVSILNFSSDIDSQFSDLNLLKLFSRESKLTNRAKMPHTLRSEGLRARNDWHVYSAVRWELIQPYYACATYLIRWGLPAISYPYAGFNSSSYTDLVKFGIIDENIRSKFSLRVFLAGFPQSNGEESEDAGKDRDRNSAANVDDGLVTFTPRENATYITLFALLAFLPFIGAWMGYRGWMWALYACILAWWALIASLFTGLWGRSDDRQRREPSYESDHVGELIRTVFQLPYRTDRNTNSKGGAAL